MNLHNAYYWGGGVTPGQRGSALILAHSFARGSAVFNPLWRVRRGMRVQIGPYAFRVTSVNTRASVWLSERQRADFRSRLGRARAVISTCNANTYDFGAKKYRHRVIAKVRRIR